MQKSNWQTTPEREIVTVHDSKYQEFQLHHAGAVDGLAGSNTTRVNLWWDGPPTTKMMQFLGRMCDALGIEGIVSVVKVEGEDHIKAQLVIDREVNTINAAAKWISAFNKHLGEQPAMLIEGLMATDTIKDAMAVGSPENFAWSGSAHNGT